MKMLCRKCGKENDNDALFCVFCGAKIEYKKKDSNSTPHQRRDNHRPVSTESIHKRKKTQKNNKTPLIIAIIISCISVLIMALVLRNKIDQTKKETPNDSTEQETTSENMPEKGKNDAVKLNDDEKVVYEEVFMAFLNGETSATWSWKDISDESDYYAGQYQRNEKYSLEGIIESCGATDGFIKEVRYAFIDLGLDGVPDMRLVLCGVGIDGVDDDSTNEYIIRCEEDGTLNVCYSYTTWSRYGAHCSYSGIITTSGSSGADTGGSKQVYIDGDGIYHDITDMTYYWLSGTNVYMCDAFKNAGVNENTLDTAFKSHGLVSDEDRSWLFVEYSIDNKTYYSCEDPSQNTERSDSDIISMLKSLGLNIYPKDEINHIIEQHELSQGIEKDIKQCLGHEEYPLDKLDQKFYQTHIRGYVDEAVIRYPVDYLGLTGSEIKFLLGNDYECKYIAGGLALDYGNIWVFPNADNEYEIDAAIVQFVAILDDQMIIDGIPGSISFPELERKLNDMEITVSEPTSFFNAVNDRNESNCIFEFSDYEITYMWHDHDPVTQPSDMVWIQWSDNAAGSFSTIHGLSVELPDGFTRVERDVPPAAGYIYDFVHESVAVSVMLSEFMLSEIPDEAANDFISKEIQRLTTAYGVTPTWVNNDEFYLETRDADGEHMIIYEILRGNVVYSLHATISSDDYSEGKALTNRIIESMKTP